MNIRETKPGHIYGVSDQTRGRTSWATIFPVRAIAIGEKYNKATAKTNYWTKSSGTATGLTVEILETVPDADGNPYMVRLPGMADPIEVKEGNVVVISGRSIQWDEEGFRAVVAEREGREREYEEQKEKERQQARSLKDRLRALGLGEWAKVDAFPDMDDAEWWPPYVESYKQWDALLTSIENARKEVNA